MSPFSPSVELFAIHGIDMLGNIDTGAVVGLTPQAARACSRVLAGEADASAIAAVDARLLDFLTKGGFFEREASCGQPRSAYVHVTQRCNLDCIGCYSMSALRNRAPDPALEDLRRIFAQLAACGASTVNISGGEPFLRADLCDVARIARDECGIPTVNVVTNGTVAESFDLAELSRWVTAVTVSIDGASAEAPAFIRREQRFTTLVAAIGRMQRAGLRVRILPTLHAGNIADAPAYVRLADELGTGLGFSLLSCPPEGGEMASLVPGEEELARLVEFQAEGMDFKDPGGPFGIHLTAKRACGAGRRNLSVDADGGVYPCHMLQSGRFLMGNVLEEDLPSILARSGGLVGRWLLPVERIDACARCEYAYICGGGCRARTVNCGAGPAGEDPYCSLSKGFYDKMFSALSEGVSGT